MPEALHSEKVVRTVATRAADKQDSRRHGRKRAKDGWFYAAGAEYEWTPQWTLRAGVAWEKSPVTDAVRGLVVPDNDRLWLSAGASWKYSSKITFDLAYSHGFVRSTSVNLVNTSNPLFSPLKGTYTGTVDTHFDIFSVALRYRFDAPSAPAKLITKG